VKEGSRWQSATMLHQTTQRKASQSTASQPRYPHLCQHLIGGRPDAAGEAPGRHPHALPDLGGDRVTSYAMLVTVVGDVEVRLGGWVVWVDGLDGWMDGCFAWRAWI